MSSIYQHVLYVFVAAALAASATVPRADPAPIREEMYVKIGGIDQWITIKGADRRNPVVLVLHGGPGDAWSPSADSMFPGWEKDFTLVQWDQRDAGRTFIKNGEAVEPTITLDRMTQDGIEVAEYLRQHLHKRKIILVGGSWGSVLGVRMVHAQSGLFASYVGVAQIVSWQKNLAASYARVREFAQSKNDRTALDVLNAVGPPPWNSIETYLSFSKVLWPYQAELATAPNPVSVASEYASDVQRYGARNAAFAFRYMWRLVTPIDLTPITDFEIPVFIVEGQADLVAPPEVARQYFETISAPRKDFYLVRGAGHNSLVALLGKAREVLLTQVRPIAVAK
jgi:pimeloyl-ACP methyl ester carboxylesterase